MTHPSRDVLADVAADLVVDDATHAHLESCAPCRDIIALFTGSADLLTDLPAEPMPEDVAQRLTAVVDNEVARRRSGTAKAESDADSAAAIARTALGSFGANPIGEKKITTRRDARI